MLFWRQLLESMTDMEMKRSTVDPCLCFYWNEDGLILVISWIDDNLIIVSAKAVAGTKINLTIRIDCEEYGKLDE